MLEQNQSFFKSSLLNYRISINPISEGGLIQPPPPTKYRFLNQVIWGPRPPKLIDIS